METELEHLELAAAILTEGGRGPSRLFGLEARNLALLLEDYPHQVPATVTVATLCELNRRVLDGARLSPAVIPGELRTTTMPVLLADALHDVNMVAGDPIAAAVIAEGRLLSLRPFTDGNRRTARVLALSIATRHTGDLLTAMKATAP